MNTPVSSSKCSVSCNASSGPLRMLVDEHLSADWTVLFGPSGSGKSTLLRLIAGLWSPAGAAVAIAGRDVGRLPAYRRGVALVAQQPSLFPHLNVRDNIVFGCKRGAAQTAWIDGLLNAFELGALVKKFPRVLSGGEQQRTALARAIAMRPNLLLLDEAFTGMHRTQQARLIDTVRAYSAELQMPVLSVTHDVAEAFRCGDEVLRINNGRIVARGTAEEVLAEERSALLAGLASREGH